MPAVTFFDRVFVSTVTTGTGAITPGAAVGPFQTFAVVPSGSIFPYLLTEGANWEYGLGTMNADGTITRAIRKSTASNNGPIALAGNGQIAVVPASADVPCLSSSLTQAFQGPLTAPTLAAATTATAQAIVASSTTQLQARYTLTGQEFYQAGNSDASNGIAMLLGVNRPGNRQFWLATTDGLTQNATNPTLWVGLIGSTVTLGARASDGQTALPLTLVASSITTTAAFSMGGLTATSAAINGDAVIARGASSGYVFLGTDKSHFVAFDGTNYQMPNGLLNVGNGGGAFNGVVTATGITSSGGITAANDISTNIRVYSRSGTDDQCKMNNSTIEIGNPARASSGTASLSFYGSTGGNPDGYLYTNVGLLCIAANGNGTRWEGGALYPRSDNALSLGTSGNRVSTVYAATSAINTSDATEKTPPEPISDALLDAWATVEWVQFQFLDAVAAKGADHARYHWGVVAQQVRDALAAHGIDGRRYGVLCFDRWDAVEEVVQPAVPAIEAVEAVAAFAGVPSVTDERGNVLEWEVPPAEAVPAQPGEPAQPARVIVDARPAGERWGIRYDLAQAIEAAYQRRRLARIEARIAQLKTAA